MQNDPRLRLLNWGWLFNWILTALAAGLLILVLACCYFYSSNIDKQQKINDRQAFLQQAALLETVFNDIAKGLLDIQAESGDKDIGTLLKSQGIALKPKTPPAPVEAPKP